MSILLFSHVHVTLFCTQWFNTVVLLLHTLEILLFGLTVTVAMLTYICTCIKKLNIELRMSMLLLSKVRPPQPSVFYFVIDVSYSAVQSGENYILPAFLSLRLPPSLTVP